MKKILIAMLSVLMIVSLLGGCAEKQQKELDAASVADAILAAGVFEDELTEMPASRLSTYYLLAESDLKAYKVYRSSTQSTPEEIAVFTASSSDTLETVKKAVDTRLEDLKAQYQDYQPQEMYKLENALVETSGDTVILVVSADHEKAAQAVKDAIK